MLKSNWQTMRLGLLAVTFVGTGLVLARLTTLPKADATTQKPENILQASVPIAGWQFVSSEPISPNKEAKAARRYRYQQGDVALDVEQHYMQSDGNVSRYLFVYSPVRTANASMKIKFQPGVGHYGLVAHDGKVYLSACVNSRGTSTVTESQFTQNRYKNDLQVSRLMPWLLGQESLIDSRCLWTLMSVPLKKGSIGANSLDSDASKDLETAWFSWHQWWQANFPPPQ